MSLSVLAIGIAERVGYCSGKAQNSQFADNATPTQYKFNCQNDTTPKFLKTHK